jgi:tRNA modification GTPase
MPENTVILLTAPGSAAIAVLRLIGPRVNNFASVHLSRRLILHRCVYCNYIDRNQIVDDVIAVRVADDIIDINLHGGPWVVQRAVELAEQFGFARVGWNEHIHAFNTEDDIERQMLLDLPRATTEPALMLLLSQPAAWRTMLQSRDLQAMQLAMNDTTLATLLSEPTVAIVGPPNVGKSTIANQLFHSDRSIVADMPGTTRDWVGAQANIDGLMVRLIDTPGQRQTLDTIEAAAIARAQPVIAQASLIVRVWNATHTDVDTDNDVAPMYDNEVHVINKSDIGLLDIPGAIHTVGTTGRGIADLRKAIRTQLGCDDLTTPRALCWRPQQISSLHAVLGRQ